MEDEKYMLTVVTAVRNLIEGGRSEMIRRCIESVARQKISGGVEHIIADGASTDGTVELINKIIQTLPKRDGYCIRVFSKPDKQVYDGMNNGLAEAHGRYILFLNSDDYLKEDGSVEKSLQDLEASGGDFCYGDVEMLIAGGHRRILGGDINRLPFAEHFCHQSMITKTEVLRKAGGFDITYRICADNDLTMRILGQGATCVKSKYAFACYRDGGLSATCGDKAKIEHGMAFYRHYGQAAGLTLEECQSLWYYTAINKASYEDCLKLLVKLPCEGWRQAWSEKMLAAFDTTRKGRPPFLMRFKRRWTELGMRGIYDSIKSRIA